MKEGFCMEQNQINNNLVSGMQLTLRKALLHKAGPETKSKFTGSGYGENVILREDAECIVATIMAVIEAKRNNSEIVIGDAKYSAKEYKTVGTGLAKCMNWNGYSYYSTNDVERPERSFVKVEVPKYVQDECMDEGKKRKAEGVVVSPTKLEQLIGSFNNSNGSENAIKIGQNIDKAQIPFGQLNFLYVNGDIRRVAEISNEYGSEFTTFMEPRVSFDNLVFGSVAEEAPGLKVLEWLI